MPYPSIKYLHYITDKDRKPYYIDSIGAIGKKSQTSGQSLALNQHPKGWNEIQISFATNQKYWSLNRSFSIPLTYLNDGAEILRHLNYNLKGFEEDVYCLILSWNYANGIYEEEYFGKLDMLLAEDTPTFGVQVTAKEGGIHSYLAANEAVTYEFSKPDVKVLFDGIKLFDKYNYSLLELYYDNRLTTIPLVFLNNEGDSVGITTAGQEEETFGQVNQYVPTSNNYFFASASSITIDKLSGEIIVQGDPQRVNHIVLAFVTSKNISFNITFGFDLQPKQIHKFIFSFPNISLSPEEKLFLVYYSSSETPGLGTKYPTIYWLPGSKFSLEFTSINSPSIAKGYRPLTLLKEIVSKMTEGKFTANSIFFNERNNLITVGGQHLRELPNAVLKTSFQDWFDDYDADYCLAMKVIDNVIWIEPKTNIYNDSTQIFDVGSVSNLKITRPDEFVVNTVKFGSPIQDYNERNGRYEFNDTKEWKLPVKSKKAELSKIGKYRRDSYGIDFVRGKLNRKDTTDNKGDNEVFKVNVDEYKSAILDFTINVENSITFTGQDDLFALFELGDTFTLRTSQNFGTFTVTLLSGLFNNQFTIYVPEPLVHEDVVAGTIRFNVLTLRRANYTQLLGVPTNTVYNIEEMTPARQLRSWMPFFNSILYQLNGEKITFQTGDKNKDLSTTLNGETITEKADIQIGSFGKAFFLPFNFTFQGILPVSFSKTLRAANAGNIKFTYRGFELYGLPIGEMKYKPVQNEVQEWSLLCSSKNDISTLSKLSGENLIALDNNKNELMYSLLNPVHLVYYNKILDSKYHFKDVFDDWLHHRNDQYATQPAYLQKWRQVDGTIPFQVITKNIGNLDLFVYDIFAQEVQTISFGAVTEPGLQLPYVRRQAIVNISGYADGRYLFAVKSSGVTIFVSEWQEIRSEWPETYLIEYKHSINRQDAYFTGYAPALRVEAFWEPNGTETQSQQYEDEPGNIELLSGSSYTRMKLHVGFPYGVPDWMENKLSNILLLNNVSIEGTKYVKPSDSKLEPNKRNGYPMASYTVDLRKANNNDSLNIDDITLPVGQVAAIATIEAEAFGNGTGVITVQLPD